MSRKRKYTLNQYVFDTIDSKEKVYWLGYLYCDGGVSDNQLSLYSKDKDIIVKFQFFLETNRPFRPVLGKVNLQYVQEISSKHLVQTLAKYGIIPNKTYDHSVPVYIPKGDLERHFWRGCIDADGSVGLRLNVYINNGKRKTGPHDEVCLTLTNRNETLLYKFKRFFDERGSVGESKSYPGCFQWLTIGSPVTMCSILDTLYQNALIYLNRKYKTYLEINQLMERKMHGIC